MPPAVNLSLAVAAAYLVGSIPFGLLIARYWHGVDVRKHGSGNIGATNVGRVLGRKWGVACLMLDFLKGLLPTLLLPRLVPLPSDWLGPAAVACGAAAIAGHVFPVWLGFRGGKGVATGAGVAVVVSWPAALAAAAAFAVVFAAKRIVSLASIVAATVYAAVTLALLREPFARENWAMAAFAVAIPALIVARHGDNIRRLRRGEEGRFRAGAAHAEPQEPLTKA
ncbi:MAG TPA: glycerol-3-phosphate 1-O-acyltransferase PlsY [Planctomycetaceae bacterium]